MSTIAVDSGPPLSPLEAAAIPAGVAHACDSLRMLVRLATRSNVRRQDGSFADALRPGRRLGCRLSSTESFNASRDTVGGVNAILHVLERHGWASDLRFTADGPDGSTLGVRRLDKLCYISAYGNVPDDDDTASVRPPPTPVDVRLFIVVECMRDVPSNADAVVPDSLWRVAQSAGFDSLYAISYRLQSPAYLAGDFDGDGIRDAAVLVEQRTTGKLGIVFLRGGPRSAVVTGAGTAPADGPDDFSWVRDWELYHKGDVVPTVRDQPTQPLPGDEVAMAAGDSALAFLVWTGNGFRYDRRR